MKRDAVDFFLVEDKHLSIHARLINWSRWNYERSGGTVSPMFRLYRTPADSNSEARTDVVRQHLPIDPLDADAIQKGVSLLPDPQRHALNWNYIKPSNPRRAAQKLGVSLEGLALLVRSGRLMLLNRGC